MSNKMKISDFLAPLPSGWMVTDILEKRETGDPEFVFILKEESCIINKVKNCIEIEILSISYIIDDVDVIAFLVRFKDYPDNIYMSY